MRRTIHATPREAAQLQSHGRIVAIEHGGTRRDVKRGATIEQVARTGEGMTLKSAGGDVRMTSDDRVVVHMTFNEGDTVPGEGIVVMHPSIPMIVGGLALLAFGSGVAGLAATCNQYDGSGSGNGGFEIFYFPPRLGCQVGLGALGVSFILPGLVVLAVGAMDHPYIEHHKSAVQRLELSPLLGPHEVGGRLQLRF